MTCGVFTHCDTVCNVADVDSAMDNSTFTVRVVTYDNDSSIVPLADTTLIVELDDSRVFPVPDDAVLILPLGGPTFIVAADDFTDVVALSDATLIAEVL